MADLYTVDDTRRELRRKQNDAILVGRNQAARSSLRGRGLVALLVGLTVSVAFTSDLYAGPNAEDDEAETEHQSSVDIDILDNDGGDDEEDEEEGAELDATTVMIVSPPSNGSVSYSSLTGKVTYTPTGCFHGHDEFTYMVQDLDGNLSNIATVDIEVEERPSPHIASFDVQEESFGFWTFSGYVDDEDPGSLSVVFGGVLNGIQVEVGDSGDFEYETFLLEGVGGLVTATTTDCCGNSDSAQDWVDPSF